MNLFTDVQQPNLFDQPGLDEPADVRTSTSISREARMAALGTMSTGDSLVGQLQAMTEKYHEQIQRDGDEAVRLEAATNQQVRELNSLAELMTKTPGFDDDGAIQMGAAMATRQALTEDAERRKSYALEQEALNKIQNLAAAGDYTQAKILLNNLEADPEDRIREINTKRMIIQREIEKAGIAKENQGWFFDVTDFLVSGLVPIQGALSKSGLVDVDKGIKNWYDSLAPGERLRSEAAGLYNMNTADFAKYVKNELIPRIKEKSTLLGYHNRSEELELLTSIGSQTPTALETNAGSAIDNVGLIFTPGVKNVMSIPKMLLRMGARKESQNVMAQAAMQMATEGAEKAAAKTGVSADEVIQGLSPSAVSVNGPMSVVPPSTGVNEILSNGRLILDEMMSMTATERLTPDELAKAQEAVVKRLSKATERPVKDVAFYSETLADGSKINKAKITIGKTTGEGYTTARAARGYANSLGYDAKIVRDESGQHFVQIDKVIPETGFATNVLNVKATNFLSRRILNANMLSDELLANMAQVAGNKKAKILKSMSDELQAPFRALTKEHRETLSQVLAAGENAGKWFDDSELNILVQRGFNRDTTPTEIAAYRAAKDINDVEFLLRNDEVYKHLAVRGFETVDLDTGLGMITKANAMVTRDFTRAEIGRVFDATTKQHITVKPDAARLQAMQDEGYMLITLKEPVKLADGTTVKQLLSKGNDVKISPLSREQLAYRPGGHRMYQGKYFVKQTVRGVQPDTQRSYLASPNTYIVAETPAEASFWANKMEEARLAWKAQKGPSEIDEIFNGHAGFDDGATFIKKMEDGVYDPDHPFVVKFDREMPEEYVTKNPDLDNFVDIEETAYNGWLRTNGRMYYSKKGDVLKDWQGAQAPTLDPFKTIDTSLNNIANITSMSDYKLSSIERWLNTYGKWLDLNDLDPGQLSHFTDSAFRRGTPAQIMQSGSTQRDIIKRNLGWKSELDLEAEQYQRTIAGWITGEDPNSIGNKAFKVVGNWWDTKDPVVGLRSMAFDMKMGFFNVAQLPMQIQTAFAATMLSPEMGLKGFSLYPSLRYFLTKSGTENALDTMIQRGVHKMSGFDDPKEFKAMMKSAKDSGFFNVDRNHNLVSQYGPGSVVGSNMMASDGKLRTAGRFFFNESEIGNRTVAWRIGWDEARKALPKADAMSPEFQRYVAGKAEKYSFSMSEQSAAWWQRGALSIPTQFWAYNVRMMEAMMGGEFTRAQRLRLVLGQSLLYGSAGLPAVSFVSDKIKEHNINKTDVNESTLKTFYGMADRGLFDTALYYASGEQIDALVGKRYGTGGFLSETIKDLMGASSYGDKSFMDVAMGATAGIMGSTFKGLTDVIRYASAETGADIEGMPMTKDAVIKTAMNVSTIGNALKAYMVFEYGTQLSNQGSTVVSDLPPVQAFATALSLQPGQQDQISSVMAYKKNRKEAIEEASRQISNYRTRWANEKDNRPEIEQQINVFTKLLPPDIRKEALRKAQRSTSSSLYEGLAEQMEKERVQNEMIEGVENGVAN